MTRNAHCRLGGLITTIQVLILSTGRAVDCCLEREATDTPGSSHDDSWHDLACTK